jgi:hypothetical protein
MFKRAAVLVVSCGALLAGCDTGPRIENEEIISNLMEAGFPADTITAADDAVYVGRDAHVSLEASREMLQPAEGSHEQYRTTNVVSTSLTKICITPSSTFNTYNRLVQGLDLAIENFNAVGLCFTLVRGSTTGCSAVITAQTMAGVDGTTGFPGGGRPAGNISIGTGLNSTTYSLDKIEYVITHTLGHAFGFRHSDFYNQAISCGTGGNEGSAGVGAIHIPGTPTTSSAGASLMNACPLANETGEFTSSDITALRNLYGC